MGVGKYSPTVTAAYMKDQKWWEKNGGNADNGTYDFDGYDSYGYNKDNLDRAGYTEEDYYLNGKWIGYGDIFVYDLYDIVLSSWSVKDNKPFLLNH